MILIICIRYFEKSEPIMVERVKKDDMVKAQEI